jgi:hypothetical protein
MKEISIDITDQTPTKLNWDAAQESDVIIIMGCGDACPVFLGKRYEDWKLDDPAGKGVDAVRPIRDEIKTRIEALPGETQAAPSPSRNAPAGGDGQLGLPRRTLHDRTQVLRAQLRHPGCASAYPTAVSASIRPPRTMVSRALRA